jgi:SHS2 domain-containing protein
MGTFRLIEHTADMGIAVEGDDLADFFRQAACGLMAVIAGDADGPGVASGAEERTVEVTGEDCGELLVNWLNEIIYQFETKGFYPTGFRIDAAQPDRLRACLFGGTFDPRAHPVEREVKAVTYHRLQVAQENGRWRAQVFVDL